MPLSAHISRCAALLADGAAELLWPTRCVGCGQPGELLCPECRASLPWVEQRWACPSCGAPFGHLTCTECDGSWPMRSMVAAMGFHGTPARMAACLKDSHELRLAGPIACAMQCALEEAAAWPARDGRPRHDPAALDAVCFVPATASAYARRGYDHMEFVARALSARLGLPLADVLVRAEARDQRELGREERARNLKGTASSCADVSGARLLLVDDVATTGASLAEATRASRPRRGQRGGMRPRADLVSGLWSEDGGGRRAFRRPARVRWSGRGCLRRVAWPRA